MPAAWRAEAKTTKMTLRNVKATQKMLTKLTLFRVVKRTRALARWEETARISAVQLETI